MDEVIYDVVQIGYGPVGQVSAAALGKLGRNVAVFEKFGSLYALPRAGHVDHEIMRGLQSVGAVSKMLEDAFRCAKYGWRNQHGQTLLEIDWDYSGVSGWGSDYLIYQPYVEDALDAAVKRSPTVAVHHGWQAMEIVEHDEFVEVELAQGMFDGASYTLTGERQRVRGRYLVGADGANSKVREAAGIALIDRGFKERWLVTDFRQKRPLSFDFDNGQICDPARPMCLFQLGQTHRRFEFMVMPDDEPEELTTHDGVWSLVRSWITPEDAELIRATIYTFRSANADRWRRGRTLLVGDAAHLMPPFLGQGMCSGVRDALSLVWKLDLVLRGAAHPDLLDTYMEERKPHVDNIIDQAVMLGKVSCTIDPEEARLRDEAFLSGQVPPPPPFPILESGVLQDGGDQASRAVRGRLGPQGRVVLGEAEGLADDILGGGWQLISRSDMVGAAASQTKAILGRLGVVIINFGAGDVVDRDGVYADYLDAAGAEAILVRPDFYVFGATASRDGLDALLADLAGKLRLREPAHA